MNIGLYFGSFNPIHIGHLIIANYIVENTEIEQVWFVVSPQNPLKPSSSLLNEYDRLNLVNLAIADNDKFRSCDLEFKLPKPSYTIDSLTYFTEKFPHHQFTVIIGSDSYQNIPKWKNFEVLLKKYAFIVYQRSGFKTSTDIIQNSKSVQILEAPMLDISATMIRNMIKNQKSVKYLLPEKVIEEINKNLYYR